MTKTLTNLLLLLFILLGASLAFAQEGPVIYESGGSEKSAEVAKKELVNVEAVIQISSKLLMIMFFFSLVGYPIVLFKYFFAEGDENVLASAKRILWSSLALSGAALIGYIIINTIRYFLI